MKKVNKIWLIVGGILVVLIIGMWWGVSHQKKDVTKDVVVSFSGYNGEGSLSYNEDTVKREILHTIAKKQGLKDDDIKRLDNASYSSEIADIYDKAQKSQELADMVKVDFSKEDKLSNGDKVTLKITAPGKDIPIKNSSREYTVTGLKKVKTVKATEIKNALKISFKGVDGLGYTDVTSKKFKDMVLKVEHNGKLKNGQQAQITISEESLDNLKEKGTHFAGNRHFKVKVYGLQNVNKINNLETVINLNTEYANNENKSSDYNQQQVELLHTYAKMDDDTSDSSLWGYGNDSDKSENNEITVNKSTKGSKKLTIFGLYKVTEKFKYTDNTEVSYKTYGIKDLTISNNAFDIESKNTDDNGVTKEYSDSLAIIQQKLGSTAVLIK